MEPEPKNSITLINCGTSLQTLGLLEQYQRTVYKHLDFWNPINKNKWNCRTTIKTKLKHLHLWNLLKIMNEIVDQIIKNPIQMLGLLEPN